MTPPMTHSDPTREAVAPGSVWTHHSGREYRVLFVANDTPDPKPGYPPTVVYEGVQNGKRWAGRLDDWHRRMTLSASPAATSAETQGADGVREAREAFSNLLRYGARSNQAGSLQLADGTLFRFDDRSAFFLSDIDRDTICAALAPSTSAATRGEPVDLETNFFAMTPREVHAALARPAPAVESAQVKVRRDDPFRPAVDVDADDDYYPSREDD